MRKTKRRHSGRRTRKGGAGENNNSNPMNVQRPKTIRIPVGPQNKVPISIPNISQHIRNVEARLAQVQFAPQNPHGLAAYGSSSNQESQIQKKGAELEKLYKKLNRSTDNLSMLRARLEMYRLNNSDPQEANKIQRQINKLLNNK
jgi:erythromycin esterase-like protein